MDKVHFIRQVQQLTHLPTEELAQDATQIVLSLLSHRLTPNEAKDVEDQLTHDMKNLWNSDTWIVNFLSISRQWQLKYRKKAELYSLIDNELKRRQIPVGAEELALAVFHVLKEQISLGESMDIAGQLPEEIERVWVAA